MGCRFAAHNQLNMGSLRVYDVAMALEVRKKHKEVHFIRAKFVMETLRNYMSSDDEDITSVHAPSFRSDDSGTRVAIPHDARMVRCLKIQEFCTMLFEK